MKKQLSRQIKKFEAKEKEGSYGDWRKEFCGRYRDLLIQIRNNSHNALIETLASKDERITCQKGCTHCCFHYVTVSIAHGIVIVDYLYSNRALLKQFLDNYEKWARKGFHISESLDRTRTQAQSSSMAIDRVVSATRPLSERYFEMNIQCPFLVDNKCLVYHLRPTICSGHYAVSSPNWCTATSQQEPVIHQLIPSDEDLSEMMSLVDPRLLLHELTLATMIYKLLTEGSSSVINAMVG